MPLIHFHAEDCDFELKQQKPTRSWILKAIASEEREPGEINIIFCSDDHLHSINTTYLHHDTLTDIITFDYCENNVISGDIFISTDRVKSNAEELKLPFHLELNRVIIHGILHLCGYKDKSQKQKDLMREKEDFYLTLLPENQG